MINFKFCITGLRWSKNSDAFSVGVPQFDITGLPGTFAKRLCILGKRYSLPRLVTFLYWYVKYLSSLSPIFPLALRFWKSCYLFLLVYIFTYICYYSHFTFVGFERTLCVYKNLCLISTWMSHSQLLGHCRRDSLTISMLINIFLILYLIWISLGTSRKRWFSELVWAPSRHQTGDRPIST